MGEDDFGDAFSSGEEDSAVGFDSSESLASPFLSNIPESDREIVGRYVKDWDAGVTKKFQELHSQYEPFKGVAVEDYQRAMQVYEMLNTDPMQVYTALQKYYEENPVGEEEVYDGSEEEPVGSTPAESRQMQLMQKQMAEMKQQLEAKLQNDEVEKQVAELDKTIKALHDKHGDFDDEAVLLRMRKGLAPEKAVEDYNKWLEDKINSRQTKPKVFPVMGTNGGSPLGQVDRSKLANAQTRKEYVAQLLAAGN